MYRRRTAQKLWEEIDVVKMEKLKKADDKSSLTILSISF